MVLLENSPEEVLIESFMLLISFPLAEDFNQMPTTEYNTQIWESVTSGVNSGENSHNVNAGHIARRSNY